MNAAEALIHYKGRDVSEKIFLADKSFLGSSSSRVQSTESLRAKLFVEFVAMIVRNRMYNLLKDALIRMDSRVNYMNVPAAIRELEKIEIVRHNNGRYQLDHAITKKQRIILSSFGIDEEHIRRTAVAIGTVLFENSAKDESEENVRINSEEVCEYVEGEIDNFASE